MPISNPFKSLFKRKGTSVRKRQEPAPARAANVVATERRPIQTPSSGLPKFQTTAADHVDRDVTGPRARERVRLRNSFTPSQPVADPRMFAGRRDLLETVIRAVEDQKTHVVIFGDRGVGKTSLLRMLTRSATEAKYIVVYFSCGATSDFSETFRTVAAEIPLLYHSSVSPISSGSDIGSSLADLLGPEKLTPRVFGDAAARLVGTRVLVILDEFDRAESQEFRRDVAELIKTLSDVSARVQLVIAGVAGDLVDLMEHIPSIRRSLSSVRVSAMGDEEVTALIENGARMSGVTFDARSTELIVSAARGSPYLTSLLCHVGGMHALDAGRARVEAEDIMSALEEVIEDFRGRIPQQVMRHLDKIGREAAGANGAGGQTARARRQATNAVSVKVLEVLEAEGLLERAKPAVQALMVDSLTHYLQLTNAHQSFVQDKAPAA